MRDLLRVGERGRFADEAGDQRAVVQLNLADPKRLRDARNEPSEAAGRHGPHLYLKPWAGKAAVPHKAGFGRHRAGQGMKPVMRRGACRAQQPCAVRRKLAVQRHARQVRADNGDLQPATMR